MKTIQDLQLQGKRVLLRCDFNVPLKGGVVGDDFRIAESVPTIRYLSQANARVLILAHLGRPGGSAREELSLAPIAKRLGELLGKEVKFIQEPIGEEARKHIEQIKPSDVALLENIRFYKGEEENDPAFAKQLASLGDFYAQDAFGVCHRAHASVVGIPQFLCSAAGLLVEKEVRVLSKIRDNPKKPLVALVGGTKVETKASFLRAISKNASATLLGNILSREVKERGLEVAEGAELVYAVDGVDGDFDLGQETVRLFAEKIRGAKTIFWAGPLGKIEEEKYEKGSLAIAEAILQSGAFAVAGGGDLAAFLGKHNLREKFAHVSTGGGAMLAFLSSEPLPGIQALEQNQQTTKLKNML